jgi:hypothetical protein
MVLFHPKVMVFMSHKPYMYKYTAHKPLVVIHWSAAVVQLGPGLASSPAQGKSVVRNTAGSTVGAAGTAVGLGSPDHRANCKHSCC